MLSIKVLASRRSEKYDDPKAGKSLMALSKGSLLELMNKSALFDMDSYMVSGLSKPLLVNSSTQL